MKINQNTGEINELTINRIYLVLYSQILVVENTFENKTHEKIIVKLLRN